MWQALTALSLLYSDTPKIKKYIIIRSKKSTSWQRSQYTPRCFIKILEICSRTLENNQQHKDQQKEKKDIAH